MSAIRILPPYERRLLTDHFKRLDPEDLHLRFGGYLSPQAVERYVKDMSWVTGVVMAWEVDGQLRGCGELVQDRALLPGSAEFALTVERAWQGQGAGFALMNAALLIACNRGLRRIDLVCLAENQRMMRIARAAGARLSWSHGEIVGEIDLPPANPLSMAQEGLQLFGGLASHSLHRLRNGSHENVASLGRDFLSPGSLGGKSVFAAR